MTIASTLTAKQYVSTGSNTQFAYPNKIFAASDLLVTIFDPSGVQYPFTNFSSGALGLSYSVQGVDVDTGCTVVLSAPFTLNWTIDIRTLTAQTQSTSIKNQGSFLPELHEEAFDRATRQTQDLMRLAYTYGVHGPDLETVPWPALPVAASRKGNALMFDALTGLPALGVPNTQTITTGLLAPFLNLGTTLAETQAGVTIVNFAFPPLTVDRYGTNTTPGTTSMTAAFQAAINVAKKGGGVVTWGLGPYLLDTVGLDLTTPVGLANCNFALIGQGRFKAATNTQGVSATPSLIIKHTGHAFDTTGSAGVHFENMSIATDDVTYPKTCFLLARNSDGNSRTDRIMNCYVFGRFSKTILYNYGAEDGVYFGNQFYNISADTDTSVFDISGFNIRALTSTFTTIATGSRSTIDHKIFAGEYGNIFTGVGTTADVFRFDGARMVKIWGPWLDSSAKNGLSSGRSLFYVDGTNAGTGPVLLSGITGEAAGTVPATFGILFSNNARVHANWVVEASVFPNITAMLGGGTGATLAQMTWFNSSNSSTGGGISFNGTISASYFDNVSGGVAAGTLTNDNNTDPISKVLSRNGEIDLTMFDTSQAVGSKGWRIRNASAQFLIATVDDAGTVVNNNLAIARNGIANWQSKIYPGTDASAPQSVAGIFGGSGVPSNANGNNGDFYLRGDTPGTANQRLYVKSSGTWVGIL